MASSTKNKNFFFHTIFEKFCHTRVFSEASAQSEEKKYFVVLPNVLIFAVWTENLYTRKINVHFYVKILCNFLVENLKKRKISWKLIPKLIFFSFVRLICFSTLIQLRLKLKHNKHLNVFRWTIDWNWVVLWWSLNCIEI